VDFNVYLSQDGKCKYPFGAAKCLTCEEFTQGKDAFSKTSIAKDKDGEKFLPLPQGAKKMLSECFEVINFPSYTECFIKGYGKDLMIKTTEKYLGIDHADTYAFGDGMNDFAMLKYAAHGAAMKNAPEKLKEIADFIATDEQDGVAEALAFYSLC
ncbi:MAG: HAD hydrolase family protein, partial [Clostridia bacterium]|nr:HAD hydrolase family protein [Clostridia bacterium]